MRAGYQHVDEVVRPQYMSRPMRKWDDGRDECHPPMLPTYSSFFSEVYSLKFFYNFVVHVRHV